MNGNMCAAEINGLTSFYREVLMLFFSFFFFCTIWMFRWWAQPFIQFQFLFFYIKDDHLMSLHTHKIDRYPFMVKRKRKKKLKILWDDMIWGVNKNKNLNRLKSIYDSVKKKIVFVLKKNKNLKSYHIWKSAIAFRWTKQKRKNKNAE